MILKNSKQNLGNYDRPEDGLTRSEITDKYGSVHEWIAQYIRFIGSRWAIDDNNQFFGPRDSDRQNGQMSGAIEQSRVDRIMHNFLYYMGRQKNYSYAYMSHDPKGNKLPAPHTKGDDVYDIVTHLTGGVNRLIGGAKPTSRSLDPAVMSKRNQKINRLKMKQDMKGFFEQIQKQGFDFVPEGGDNISIDAKIREIETKSTDLLELFTIDIMRDFENKNNLKTQMGSVGTHTAIGGMAGIHIIDDDIRPRSVLVPSYSLVTDQALDNDYGYHQSYVGKVEHKSLSEIISQYELTKPEIEALRARHAADEKNDKFRQNLNSRPWGAIANFQWWGAVDSDPRIQVITGYFVANKADKNGKIKTSAFGGTLIGNLVLHEGKELDNIVYHRDDPNMPVLPIIICKPGTILGQNVSPVDRLKKLQDDIDAYELAIKKSISRDKGKVYLINGSVIGKGSDSVQISTDFEQMGVHVTGSRPVDELMLSGNPKMVEMVDMTLDPNVIRYIELIKERRELMRMRISASKVSMGQQNTYIGLETQQNTIARNNLGSGVYFDTILQSYVNVLWYVVNKVKIFMLDPENAEEAESLWGDRHHDFFSLIERWQTEELQIQIGVEDIIDEQARERILAIAHDQAQNVKESGFTMLDYLQVERAQTFTELFDAFEKRLQEIQRKKEEKEAMMVMLDQIQKARAMAIENDHRNKDRQAKIQAARIGAEKREVA